MTFTDTKGKKENIVRYNFHLQQDLEIVAQHTLPCGDEKKGSDGDNIYTPLITIISCF